MADKGSAQAPALFAQSERLARKALLLEPSSVSAIRNLGFVTADRDRSAARKLMLLGARLSRRNGGLNLWLSEDFARQGNEREALKYFDATMRTNSATANTLMPAMAMALRRPGAPAAFEEILAGGPQWQDDFWTAVLSQPGDLSNAVDLRMRLHRRKVPMMPSHDALLIQYLANSNRVEEAFALFALASKTRARGDDEMLLNPDFTAASAFPPIDWKVVSGPNYASDINARRGVLSISAIGGAAGIVAQQLIQIDPGRYQLEVRYSGERGARVPLQAHLTCAQLAGERTLNLTFALGATASQAVELPPPCRYVWVSLQIAPTPDSAAFDVSLDRLSLRRIG